MHNEAKRISFTNPGLSYTGSSLVQNAPRIRNKIVTFIDKGVSPACTTEKKPCCYNEHVYRCLTG